MSLRTRSSRRGRATLGAVAVLLPFAFVATGMVNAVTASNRVAPPRADDSTSKQDINDFKPSDCTMHLDELLTGSGTITGSKASEFIIGDRGPDRIDGSDGDDCIMGGDGDDSIDGGPGYDVCIGGPGRDGFRRCEVEIQ